jgi:heme/copper-type cytochrome/quinol oxidase subunit 4
LEEYKSDQKFLYIEDKHHIGDLDLLHNEAEKGENKSNVITFTVMFAIMCIATVFCCYLNYNFPSKLSKDVFIVFAIAFISDQLITRTLLLFLYSLIKTIVCCAKGYKRLEKSKKLL